MLGFGFNKDKTRASAERFVQQGKLQNAIAEYDKILKHDPKDLTILNTVGDLYARLGQIEQAVVFFKLVGDSYASEGFVPKAIAMYKKLTKLSPAALECVQKLAELYTQQGLYNDARAQYLQVADLHERDGRKGEAIKVYLKVRDLDPDNWTVTNKLAKLYRTAGKNGEAIKLLMSAAESLRTRKAYDAADEALLTILQMEPSNSRALELRAAMAFERGETATAVAVLEKIADIDSRPEPLGLLLKANLQLGRMAEAEPVARKLLSVHNDCAGLFAFTDKLFASEPKQALAIYREFSDRLLAADRDVVVSHLRGAVSSLREDIPALESIQTLFSQAGEDSETGDINELIAHASVKNGDFERARDLYLKLAQLEPANPTHAQNYRQVMLKLGADASAIDEPVNNSERPFAEPPEADDTFSAEETEASGFSASSVADFEIVAENDEPEPQSALEAAADQAALIPPSDPSETLEFEVAAPPAAPSPIVPVGTVHEIDISDEWESAASELSTPEPQPQVSEAQIADLVEEITFYISQEMWSEASFACDKLEEIAPNNRELPRLRALIVSGKPGVEPEETIEIAPVPETTDSQTEPDDLGSTRMYDLESGEDIEEPVTSTGLSPLIEESPAVSAGVEIPSKPADAKLASPAPTESTIEAAEGNFLGHFVEDLDSSLGSDFNLSTTPTVPTAPVAPQAAIQSANGTASPQDPQPQPQPVPAPPPTPVAVATTPQAPQSSMLDELFQEFKEEMGDNVPEEEDPETHYNLGVAFREMGLLDEAIGELQKVCLAVQHGTPFAQSLQAYTWLAHCFVEKGVPEASFKWYQNALGLATDNDTKTAIHYELANAYEVAGFRHEALVHYMEVYTTNIDYRDVGERIKALRS